MNIIFAVPSQKNGTYQLLSRSISGSSIGTIERDSQNVVALVSGEYEVRQTIDRYEFIHAWRWKRITLMFHLEIG